MRKPSRRDPREPRVLALWAAVIIAAPAPLPVPTLAPAQLLARIREQFRSHRPPPAFETYTIERKQQRNDGYPDVANSYVFHVWVRNSDRAAMKRQVFRDDYEYPPVFDRPAFNEARDPGPPTADVFEPRPLRPHPASQAYSPEPASTPLALIGRVGSLIELDYRVIRVAYENDLVHLTLVAIAEPERNRLREVYADRVTYEVRKLVAADRLFITGGFRDTYADEFTLTMGVVSGVPVVTRIHGVAGFDAAGLEYQDDGKIVDYTFRDITFPATLPDWYFNPRQYGVHTNDLPQ
jgi:hypothetical protein